MNCIEEISYYILCAIAIFWGGLFIYDILYTLFSPPDDRVERWMKDVYHAGYDDDDE